MEKIHQTKKCAALCAQAELAGIVAAITRFDRQCHRDYFTDTGEAWELLHALRRNARRALRELKRAQS